MKKLSVAVFAAVLGLSATAFAQAMPGPQQPPPAQPAQPAQMARFAPQPLKGQDMKGLTASIKANNDAWDHQDVNAILNAWVLPASIITTDSAGNPSSVNADMETLRAAFQALFNEIPKPGPGQKSAEFKFGGQNIQWVSNSLAVVTYQVNLQQGMGKQMYKQSWKVSQVWTREPAGWRIRGYVGSGWGDLLKH